MVKRGRQDGAAKLKSEINIKRYIIDENSVSTCIQNDQKVGPSYDENNIAVLQLNFA
jgi:hypothetical protein